MNYCSVFVPWLGVCGWIWKWNIYVGVTVLNISIKWNYDKLWVLFSNSDGTQTDMLLNGLLQSNIPAKFQYGYSSFLLNHMVDVFYLLLFASGVLSLSFLFWRHGPWMGEFVIWKVVKRLRLLALNRIPLLEYTLKWIMPYFNANWMIWSLAWRAF
jgi:hypothetical protein